MKIKRAKKGVTLVELTIVLALVAIIGTAVVAFTVALSNRVKNSAGFRVETARMSVL